MSVSDAFYEAMKEEKDKEIKQLKEENEKFRKELRWLNRIGMPMTTEIKNMVGKS